MSEEIKSLAYNHFLLNEEKLRRRKERLIQVREQSKGIALKIRQTVSDAKKRQLDFIDQEVKEKANRNYQSQLESYQEQYSACLKQLGFGHDISSVAQLEKYRQEKEQLDSEISNIRGQIALSEVERKKSIQEIRAQQRIKQRELTLKQEKERAAKIASLPPHPPDPLDNMEINTASTFSMKNVTTRSKKSSRSFIHHQEYPDVKELHLEQPIVDTRDHLKKPFFPKIIDSFVSVDNKENCFNGKDMNNDNNSECYSYSELELNVEKDCNLERTPADKCPCSCCRNSSQKGICKHVINPRYENRLQREIAFKNSQQKRRRDSKGRIGYVTSFRNRRHSRGGRPRNRLSGRYSENKTDLKESSPSSKVSFPGPKSKEVSLPSNKKQGVATVHSDKNISQDVLVERATSTNKEINAYALAEELNAMEDYRRHLKNLQDENECLKIQERYSLAQERINLKKDNENYQEAIEAYDKAEKARKLKEFCLKIRQQRQDSARQENEKDKQSAESVSKEGPFSEEELKSDSSTFVSSSLTETPQPEISTKEDSSIVDSRNDSSVHSLGSDILNLAQLSFDQSLSTPDSENKQQQEVVNKEQQGKALFKPSNTINRKQEKKPYFPPLQCEDIPKARGIPLQTVQKDMSGIFASQIDAKQKFERVRENKINLQSRFDMKCLADEHQILHKCSQSNVHQNSRICPEACNTVGTTIVHDISCSSSVYSPALTSSSEKTVCQCNEMYFSTPIQDSFSHNKSPSESSKETEVNNDKGQECTERELKLRQLLATIITHRGLSVSNKASKMKNSNQEANQAPSPSNRPAFIKTYVQVTSKTTISPEHITEENQNQDQILNQSPSSLNDSERKINEISKKIDMSLAECHDSSENVSDYDLKMKKELYLENEDKLAVCQAVLQRINQEQDEIQNELNKVRKQLQGNHKNSDDTSENQPSKESSSDIEIARYSSTLSSSFSENQSMKSPIPLKDAVFQSSSETIKASSLPNTSPSFNSAPEIESCARMNLEMNSVVKPYRKTDVYSSVETELNSSFSSSVFSVKNENWSPLDMSGKSLTIESPMVAEDLINCYSVPSPQKKDSLEKIESPVSTPDLEEEWLTELRNIIKNYAAFQSTLREEAYNIRPFYGLSWNKKPPVTATGRNIILKPHELSTITEMDSSNASNQSLGRSLSVMEKENYSFSGECNSSNVIMDFPFTQVATINEDKEKITNALSNSFGQRDSTIRNILSPEEISKSSSSTSVYPPSTSSSSSVKADEYIECQDLKNTQTVKGVAPELCLLNKAVDRRDNINVCDSLGPSYTKEMMGSEPNFVLSASSQEQSTLRKSLEMESKWEWPLKGKGISDESVITLVDLEDSSFENPNTSTPRGTPKKGSNVFSPSSPNKFKTEEGERCLTPITLSPSVNRIDRNHPSEVSISESLLSFQRHELSAFNSDTEASQDEGTQENSKSSSKVIIETTSNSVAEDKENQLLLKDVKRTSFSPQYEKKIADGKLLFQLKSNSPILANAIKQSPTTSKSVSPNSQLTKVASTPSPKPLELRRVLQSWKNSRTLSDF